MRALRPGGRPLAYDLTAHADVIMRALVDGERPGDPYGVADGAYKRPDCGVVRQVHGAAVGEDEARPRPVRLRVPRRVAGRAQGHVFKAGFHGAHGLIVGAAGGAR